MKTTVIALITLCLILLCDAPCLRAEGSWDNMMRGIQQHSNDVKTREEFDKLCNENETALINGKEDTGDGLYMLTDIPVYLKPNDSKTAELLDDTRVILLGETVERDGSEWVKIKFMRVSDYSEKAVSIEEGWVAKAALK